MEKIQYSDILYLEADINYTRIHLVNGKVIVSPRTLLFHVQKTLNDSFIRIHQSFAVNKHFITEVLKEFDAQYVMLGSIKLSVSRRKQKILTDNFASEYSMN